MKRDTKGLVKRDVRLNTAMSFFSDYSLLQLLKSYIFRKKEKERRGRRGREGGEVLSIPVLKI